MKNIIIILIIGLCSRLPLLSQGVINFDINFGINPPPNTSGGFNLVSSARLSTDDTFWEVLYLGAAPPDSGFIGQMDGDTFTPLFQFTKSFMELQIREYGYIGSWQLTDAQVRNLLAGQWYTEVVYSDASFIGQITAVPEPSSSTLLLAGLVVIFSCVYHRVVLPPMRVRASSAGRVFWGRGVGGGSRSGAPAKHPRSAGSTQR